MFWSVQQRRENKKLRNSGLEYISRSGKTVAAKKQPGNRYQQYISYTSIYKCPLSLITVLYKLALLIYSFCFVHT